MKKIIPAAFILNLVACFYGQAQNEVIQNQVTYGIEVFDTYGRAFTNPLADVAGTPYLTEDWKPATLLIREKDVFTNIPVKLDLVKQEVHFMSQKGVEMVLPPGLIRELFIVDSSAEGTVKYHFKSRYPALESQNEQTLYLVLSSGKMELLKYLRKKVRTQKNDVSGEVSKELVTYEDYYLQVSGTIVSIKRSKDFFLGKMEDRKKEMEDYLQKNKISFKSEADLQKLVDHYNAL
jgi:hypothetical protein